MYLHQWLIEKKLEARSKGKKYWNNDFAKELGMSSAMLSQYINGKAIPTRHVALFIQRITRGKVRFEDFIKFQEDLKNGNVDTDHKLTAFMHYMDKDQKKIQDKKRIEDIH
jgi:transcriptional regulator with XRE-family HTH domain